MDSSRILDKIDLLIDDLLNDGDVSASSLAAILMAARESVKRGYHIALARKIWDASNALQSRGIALGASLPGIRRLPFSD